MAHTREHGYRTESKRFGSGRLYCIKSKEWTDFLPYLTYESTTQRELEILQLIQKGLLSKEIAYNLRISIHTVHIHRQNLLHKLGVQNSIEAINAGLELGVLS